MEPVAAVRDAARPSSVDRLRPVLPTLTLVVVLVLVWEFLPVVISSSAYSLPRFHEVIAAIGSRSDDLLLPAAKTTIVEILLGFALGVAAGVALGAAIAMSPFVRQALSPLLVGSQAVPVIAIAPILTIWFGFGVFPKVLMAALISFFPVAMNTAGGLDSVNQKTLRLMASFGASRWTTFRQVRLPAALPFVLTGVRTAAAVSVVGAVVGEWVGAASGLGPVMTASISGFQPDITFAAILYLGVIGVLLYAIVAVVEHRVVSWHYEQAAAGSSRRRRGGGR